jgi:hypothetical protein
MRAARAATPTDTAAAVRRVAAQTPAAVARPGRPAWPTRMRVAHPASAGREAMPAPPPGTGRQREGVPTRGPIPVAGAEPRRPAAWPKPAPAPAQASPRRARRAGWAERSAGGEAEQRAHAPRSEDECSAARPGLSRRDGSAGRAWAPREEPEQGTPARRSPGRRPPRPAARRAPARREQPEPASRSSPIVAGAAQGRPALAVPASGTAGPSCPWPEALRRTCPRRAGRLRAAWPGVRRTAAPRPPRSCSTRS